MSKNKLYNQSYFVKRVLDAGFDVYRLPIKFEEDDQRRWMIIVNSKKIPYKANICITCFKNHGQNDFSFKMQGQSERDFTLKTLSMMTVINLLNEAIKDKENGYFINKGDNNND